MQGTAMIEVSIVEDDRVLRDGLRALLDGTPGYRCALVFD